MLDLHLGNTRAKRTTGDAVPRRTALLVGALVLIVGGGCAALLVLQSMLSDLPQRPLASSPQTEQSTEQSGNFQEQERPGTSPAKTR